MRFERRIEPLHLLMTSITRRFITSSICFVLNVFIVFIYDTVGIYVLECDILNDCIDE